MMELVRRRMSRIVALVLLAAGLFLLLRPFSIDFRGERIGCGPPLVYGFPSDPGPSQTDDELARGRACDDWGFGLLGLGIGVLVASTAAFILDDKLDSKRRRLAHSAAGIAPRPDGYR
jgi:hypothetical protein